MRPLFIENKQISKNTYLINFLCNNIDYANANDLSLELNRILVDRNINRILFDLNGIEFIGSSGLLVFLNAKRKLEAKNGKFAMINVKEQLEQTLMTFNIPELMKSFRIFQSEQEAKDFLKK